jgi:hypothetical protein
MILKRSVLTAIMSLLVGVLPAAVTAGPASAASSTGVQRFHYSECAPELFLCWTGDQQIEITENKTWASLSGHQNWIYTYDNGACRQVIKQKTSDHTLIGLSADGPQQYKTKFDQTATFSACSGEPAKICTLTEHYLYANGAVRLDSGLDASCKDV